ncbi:MAG: TrkA family potassium uptake protein [Spirochaetaceae bacterium]|nr:TrkA family potassium uptake protein [Spirochaetaceae bacterium]
MRQYAIIGLGAMGVRMLEKLSEVTDEIILIDKDADLVERYKEMAAKAYVVDAINDAALRRVIPEGLDAAIVDLGGNIEAAILVTNILKKLCVVDIIVKAVSEEAGEIFELVGATRVVYPDREAASRVVPLLVSPSLFNFMPIGSNLVMAEVRIPEKYAGMSLIEANLRQRHGINVIALRSEGSPEYSYFNADYKLRADDILLVAGKEAEVIEFSGVEERMAKGGIREVFAGLLKGRSGTNRGPAR